MDLRGETFYLLLIHTDNIAHFFHDVFFPFYVQWRKNKKRVCVSIKGNSFQSEFLESIIGPENLIFMDYETPYSLSDLIITPEGRDLTIYPEYIAICEEIKRICFANNGIEVKREKNLIYGRNELSRKNLLDIDSFFLEKNQIERVTLSSLSFRDTIAHLAQAKSFTYMVGAGVFYLLFLDKKVPVLEINPAKNNSWAQMFGLDKLCSLNIFVSQNIETTSDPAQADNVLDSHVYFDDAIKEKLVSMISSN